MGEWFGWLKYKPRLRECQELFSEISKNFSGSKKVTMGD
jgi:hypothetical protein